MESAAMQWWKDPQFIAGFIVGAIGLVAIAWLTGYRPPMMVVLGVCVSWFSLLGVLWFFRRRLD